MKTIQDIMARIIFAERPTLKLDSGVDIEITKKSDIQTAYDPESMVLSIYLDSAIIRIPKYEINEVK